ncbi:MAG: FtsX-like permease family protein [Phycisphaerae bacterium]|jgi:lipoprotein-releasing system permease protein
MYKWFLAARYLYTKLIALFAVASVMLCVAMVLVVMSVMGGFLDTIRARARGLHSEIVLDNGMLQGFPFYEEFGDYIARELPDLVESSTPVIYTYGIFRVPVTTLTKTARVVGIRLDEYVKVNDFQEGLHYETYFPGTTRLGMQGIPVAAIEGDSIRLPRDLIEANKNWRDTEADPEAVAAFERHPFEYVIYPDEAVTFADERAFAADAGPPRYQGPERYGVIVGCDLLNPRREDGNFTRYYARGTEVAVTLMPLSPTGTASNEPPVRLPLRYVDDSRTGIFEIDSSSIYVDFEMLQKRLAMDPQPLLEGGSTKARTNQLLVDTNDAVELNEARRRVAAAWDRFYAQLPSDLTYGDAQGLKYVTVSTWEDLQREFIAAVEKEKILVTILFALISMVAILLIGCIFYMIVEKKTRDIGILKSLGASSIGVAAMFIIYAAVVGVVGSVLGTFVGTVFVWNINDIQDWLASLNPQLRVWSPTIYSFDRIPDIVKHADVLWICAVAIVSSMLGSLIPAWFAGRIWPVEALRYE